jgi:hypothetical protein
MGPFGLYNIANMKNPLRRQARSEPFFARSNKALAGEGSFIATGLISAA